MLFRRDAGKQIAWILAAAASALPVHAQDIPPPQPPAAPPNFATPASLQRPPVPNPEALFEPGRIVARVGDQFIFLGDLQGEANVVLAPLLEKIPEAERESQARQIEAERQRVVKQLLDGAIQRKLLYLDFLRQAGKVPDDKRKEMFAKIQKSTDDYFTKNLEGFLTKVEQTAPDDLQELYQQDLQLTRLALLMKQKKLVSERELDQYLREQGSTLQQQRQIYMERMLGNEARRKEITTDFEISHEQMLNYYRQNIKEYLVPAKVRWEQLSVQFEKFPDKVAAGEAIANMGNEAYLGGAFAPVAKRGSQEPNADEGGYHDWLSQGSLKAKQLEQALFSLPIGQMSPIIEDGDGLHIVRVLERQESKTIPFDQAQDDIKEKLRQAELKRQFESYVERLRRTIPVSTIYDEEKE